MKYLYILFIFFSCHKAENFTILGCWQLTTDCNYFFDKELKIIEDSQVEVYNYSLIDNMIFLDYGLPFKIEYLDGTKMILSKTDNDIHILYEFIRI